MAYIHVTSSCGKYNSTVSVCEDNVLTFIDSMLSFMAYFFGGGHVELYDESGNIIDYFEV